MRHLPTRHMLILACAAGLGLGGCVPFAGQRQSERERDDFMLAYAQSQSAANVDRANYLRSEIEALKQRVTKLELSAAGVSPGEDMPNMPPETPEAAFRPFEAEPQAAPVAQAPEREDGIAIPSGAEPDDAPKLPAVPPLGTAKGSGLTSAAPVRH